MGKKGRNKKTGHKKALISVDRLAKGLYGTLAADFRALQGDVNLGRKAESLLQRDMAAFRDYEFIEHEGLRPLTFKIFRQLNNFLAKYTFKNDVLDADSRYSLTLKKLGAELARVGTIKPWDYPTELVVKRARAIISKILGEHPKDIHVYAPFAKVGTRATRLCGLAHAGLVEYLTDPTAFSSSSECKAWLLNFIADDPLLNSLWRDVCSKTQCTESLVVSLVAKKWDKDRPITPLQVGDLFYSYLYATLVEILLADVGLNLSTLQERHRKIVKRQSVVKNHVTADLSGGSGNIAFHHMARLIPRPWLRSFKRCLCSTWLAKSERSNSADELDVCFKSPSVLPMGNALTFPLETLMFYGVIEAVRQLAGVRGFCSVYGDDLIYPRRIHGMVSHVFRELNWGMNLTKTFCESPFRESCGEDFYRGAAVRPYFFPDVRHSVGKMEYRRILYQIYNGLVQRWRPQEIRTTLKYLLIEISMYGEVYRVPLDYADYAGIRCRWPFKGDPMKAPYSKIFIEWCPDIQNLRFSFPCLSETTIKRVRKTAIPIYWDYLRQKEAQDLERIHQNLPISDPLGYLNRSEVSNLAWRSFKRRVKVKGKVVREYSIWKIYYPTKKTRKRDDFVQTHFWSDVQAWFGSAGYLTPPPLQQ